MVLENNKLDEIIEFFKTQKEKELQVITLEKDQNITRFNLTPLFISLIAVLLSLLSISGIIKDLNTTYILWAIIITLFASIGILSYYFKEQYNIDESFKNISKKYGLIVSALQARKILDIGTDLTPLKNLIRERYLRNKQQVIKDERAWLDRVLYCVYLMDSNPNNEQSKSNVKN